MLNIFEFNEMLYKHQDRETERKEIVGNYGNYIAHAKKGKKWAKHKYLYIDPKTGRYVYNDKPITKKEVEKNMKDTARKTGDEYTYNIVRKSAQGKQAVRNIVTKDLPKTSTGNVDYAKIEKVMLDSDEETKKTRDAMNLMKNVHEQEEANKKAIEEQRKSNYEKAKAADEANKRGQVFAVQKNTSNSTQKDAAKSVMNQNKTTGQASPTLTQLDAAKAAESRRKADWDKKQQEDNYRKAADAAKAEEERRKKGMQHSAFSISDEEMEAFMKRNGTTI